MAVVNLWGEEKEKGCLLLDRINKLRPGKGAHELLFLSGHDHEVLASLIGQRLVRVVNCLKVCSSV